MINNRKFSDDEIKEILKGMVILVDTREKGTPYVEDWCNYKNRCETKRIKLDNGDYSVMLKKNEKYGIMTDLYFDREIAVERKNSLDELSGNFLTHRSRFKHEFGTYNGKMTVVVADKIDNLFMGKYKAKYDRRAFIASIQSFEHEFGITFRFMSNEAFPVWLHTHLYYYLRHKLKKE